MVRHFSISFTGSEGQNYAKITHNPGVNQDCPETVNHTTETVPYNGTNHFNFTLFVNYNAFVDMLDVQD